MFEVPPEFRSTTPSRLRDVAETLTGKVTEVQKKLLLEAAAEIEGSEEAFATLVSEKRELHKKLVQTERNLRATIDLIPRSNLV